MAAPLGKRLGLLAEITELSAGRVPAELTERSRRVQGRASDRLSLGSKTVVALAGATGSGKSSLFNAIAGQKLAESGARRPTTSETYAVSFGPSEVALLDWLQITRRNEVPATVRGLEDLVLLDLPDHDSTEAGHRAEVDRMVKVVDQFVFVVDPQKYADAAIHQLYLRPLAKHRDVITVVLNQVDRLSPDEVKACLANLKGLLDADGLTGVPLLAVSARTGQGVPELRDRLAQLAAKKTATASRLAADVEVLTDDYARALGDAATGAPAKDVVAELNSSLEAAAGVPIVVDAVRRSMVQRGSVATGWPLTSWIAKLRPDPLRRLRIGSGRRREITATVTERSSLPMRGAVADARLSTGLRALATQLGQGMQGGWRQAMHDAVHTNVATLPDSLDEAVVTSDLGTDRTPIWWQLLRVLQWLLIGAVAVGALWLLANFAMLYFQLPALPLSRITLPNGLVVPLPTLLVIGGLVVGLVLGVLSRVFVGLGARSAAMRARKVLRRRVAEVGQREVVAPATEELERYTRARQLVGALR